MSEFAAALLLTGDLSTFSACLHFLIIYRGEDWLPCSSQSWERMLSSHKVTAAEKRFSRTRSSIWLFCCCIAAGRSSVNIWPLSNHGSDNRYWSFLQQITILMLPAGKLSRVVDILMKDKNALNINMWPVMPCKTRTKNFKIKTLCGLNQ